MSRADPALASLLTTRIAGWASAHGPGLTVGLSGPQGSGKTTLCAVVADRLEAAGLRTAVLALDDLYLLLAERQRRARDLHPLFRTRGPPGTHDAALGLDLLRRLRRPGSTELPVFDKARDDRDPMPRRFEGPAAVVILEGWCVGARPQPAAELAEPLNTLEREEDADGRWRAAVDAQLAGDYARLWAACDRQVRLRAPDWPSVRRWRGEAEAELRARSGGGMAQAELDRFLQHYQRLTCSLAEQGAAGAHLVVDLEPDRTPRVAAP